MKLYLNFKSVRFLIFVRDHVTFNELIQKISAKSQSRCGGQFRSGV